MDTRTCIKCNVEKSLDLFCADKRRIGGRTNVCRQCYNLSIMSDERRAYWEERKNLFTQGLKRCAKCDIIKEHNAFRLNKRTNDGFRAYCRDCENMMSLEYDRRADVINKRKEREGTNEAKERRRKYRQTSEKFAATQKKYEESQKRKEGRRRYAGITHVRVERRLRSRVYEAMTLGKAKRKIQFWELVGCDLDFFMKYIESKWIEGMSWDNYTHKGWHLDHIRPCASFDLTDPEQQKQCFHYTNYQPLWQFDNFSKGSFIDGVKHYRKK